MISFARAVILVGAGIIAEHAKVAPSLIARIDFDFRKSDCIGTSWLGEQVCVRVVLCRDPSKSSSVHRWAEGDVLLPWIR